MPFEFKGGIKFIVMLVGILSAIVLALVATDRGNNLLQTFQNKNPKNTISITAEGKASAVPDIATISVGVLTSGDTADGVQNESSKKINKIIEFLKTKGVDKADINTTQFNIYPMQDYREGKTIITGYQANQTVTIKVRHLDQSTDQLSKILGGVTSAGANQINGVDLDFDDPDAFRQKAREQAIEKAKEKAQALAQAAGLKLGRVVSISESSGGSMPIPYYDGAYGGIGGGGAERSVSPNIEPGMQDIIASMTVIFEIR
jgi:uncharacterized protein YggE